MYIDLQSCGRSSGCVRRLRLVVKERDAEGVGDLQRLVRVGPRKLWAEGTRPINRAQMYGQEGGVSPSKSFTSAYPSVCNSRWPILSITSCQSSRMRRAELAGVDCPLGQTGSKLGADRRRHILHTLTDRITLITLFENGPRLVHDCRVCLPEPGRARSRVRRRHCRPTDLHVPKRGGECRGVGPRLERTGD